MISKHMHKWLIFYQCLTKRPKFIDMFLKNNALTLNVEKWCSNDNTSFAWPNGTPGVPVYDVILQNMLSFTSILSMHFTPAKS